MTQDPFIQSRLEAFDKQFPTEVEDHLDGEFINRQMAKSFLTSSLRAAMMEGRKEAIDEVDKWMDEHNSYNSASPFGLMLESARQEKPNEGTA